MNFPKDMVTILSGYNIHISRQHENHKPDRI